METEKKQCEFLTNYEEKKQMHIYIYLYAQTEQPHSYFSAIYISYTQIHEHSVTANGISYSKEEENITNITNWICTNFSFKPNQRIMLSALLSLNDKNRKIINKPYIFEF